MPALRNSEPPSLVNPRSNVSTLSRAPSFKSASYVRALADAERFARDNDATILIEGESGTGKTQLARHLHTVSPRATGPFHGCALTGVQDSLAESDLFGHAMGAFTGAKQRRAGMFVTASGGTLFLDEIGKASHRVQQLLLDSIEYHRVLPVGADRYIPVDVRVIVASNVALESLVLENLFLADLYARLRYFRVVLPPLRQRKADIPILVEQCIEKYTAARPTVLRPSVHRELMEILMDAPWPDNVRELDATVHRLIVDAEGGKELTPNLCTGTLATVRDAKAALLEVPTGKELREFITAAGGVAQAAQRLGVHRSSVYRMLNDDSAPPDH